MDQQQVSVKEVAVSVIMAARNMELYIGDAIQSVLDQSFRDWELLVVENDSHDGTADVIKQFSDPRIILIQTDKPGLGNARNLGLDRAAGRFICFLDADDRLPIDSLQVRVDVLGSDPAVHFVDGMVETYDANFSKLLRSWLPAVRGNVYREMHTLQPRCFAGITWMIRRMPNMKYAFVSNLSYLEDRVFYLSLCETGNYTFVQVPTYQIRRRPESLMTNLQRLEKGYLDFMKMIHSHDLLSDDDKKRQWKEFHWLFFKTWLKGGRFVVAFKHLIQYFIPSHQA